MVNEALCHKELQALDNEIKLLSNKSEYLQEKLKKHEENEQNTDYKLKDLKNKIRQLQKHEIKIAEKAKEHNIDFENEEHLGRENEEQQMLRDKHHKIQRKINIIYESKKSIEKNFDR